MWYLIITKLKKNIVLKIYSFYQILLLYILKVKWGQKRRSGGKKKWNTWEVLNMLTDMSYNMIPLYRGSLSHLKLPWFYTFKDTVCGTPLLLILYQRRDFFFWCQIVLPPGWYLVLPPGWCQTPGLVCVMNETI